MIKTTTWTVIWYGDISDVATERLGKPYDALDGCAVAFYEISNGSTHPVTVPHVPDSFEQKEWAQALANYEIWKAFERDPDVPAWQQHDNQPPPVDVRVILNELHKLGEIEAGDYFIECWW